MSLLPCFHSAPEFIAVVLPLGRTHPPASLTPVVTHKVQVQVVGADLWQGAGVGRSVMCECEGKVV